MSEPVYISIQEAAARASLSKHLLLTWIKSGKLKALKTSPNKGGRWRVKWEDVERVLLEGAQKMNDVESEDVKE
jgi:excisionase family DNA binding protein